MKWLLTIRSSADLDEVINLIKNGGGELDPEKKAIPLDNNQEWVLSVDGPENLPDFLATNIDIIEVYPDSELSLY